jgi:hypothetical protein
MKKNIESEYREETSICQGQNLFTNTVILKEIVLVKPFILLRQNTLRLVVAKRRSRCFVRGRRYEWRGETAPKLFRAKAGWLWRNSA